jgi:PH (Pleckstrin Homology) domain-containing protein
MAPVSTVVYRSNFGQVLTVVVGALCGVTAVVTAVGGGFGDLLRFGPWLALVAGACWTMFWRPRVEVSDGGVRLVNVTRTIDVPWPAITALEIRWALTLHTDYGRFTAWAAPASGRGPVRKAARVEFALPSRAASRRPDPVATNVAGAAGDAAELVIDRWEQLRAAGHLDNPVLEHAHVPVRWHVGTIAAGAALVALGLLGLIM